jgi:hypothetical protein
MARALRTDLLNSGAWTEFIHRRKTNLDIKLVEKCPRCDVTYTLFVTGRENTQYVIRRLQKALLTACPDHAPPYYTIYEPDMG